MMNASCVFSGEVEGETVDKSSGTADLINVSVMASGEGNAVTADKLSSPPEYPRVTRLRHRRLMAYLWCQGFRDSYNELMNKTRAHMNLLHLCGLIEVGRWADAIEYVDRFLPPATCPKSFFADVFRCFLVMLHRFADAAAGKEDKLLPKHYLELNHGKAVSHADLRLSSICMSVIALDGVRANINWQRVWRQASSLVYTLARCVPELRGCVALPTAGIKPHHVLPIASGLRRQRRYVKLKNTGSKKRKAIISALKRQCRISSRIGSVEEAKELLADLLDASVRSGVQMLSSDLSHPLENEGAQFFQPMSGTLTEAKTSGPLTEAKTSGPLTNAGAQFRQLIPGTLTEAKTSGPSTNAGTSKHEEEAGYHTITARQDSDGRKNSRDELATAEQDRALKRQRSNGAPGEATLVMPGYCAGEVLSAKPSGGETAAP